MNISFLPWKKIFDCIVPCDRSTDWSWHILIRGFCFDFHSGIWRNTRGIHESIGWKVRISTANKRPSSCLTRQKQVEYSCRCLVSSLPCTWKVNNAGEGDGGTSHVTAANVNEPNVSNYPSEFEFMQQDSFKRNREIKFIHSSSILFLILQFHNWKSEF